MHALRGTGHRRDPRDETAASAASADVIPDPDDGTLCVRIPDSASKAGNAAVAGLPYEPDRTLTIFPGTDRRVVRELPGNGTDPDIRVSR